MYPTRRLKWSSSHNLKRWTPLFAENDESLRTAILGAILRQDIIEIMRHMNTMRVYISRLENDVLELALTFPTAVSVQ